MNEQNRKIQNNLNRLRRKLIILPENLILDEDFDSERTEQNDSHSYVFHIIMNVKKELQNIKIRGVEDEELDKAWNDLCSGTLLKDEYNHNMRYIEYLESKIKEVDGISLEKT